MRNITTALLLSMAVLLCSCSAVLPSSDNAEPSTTQPTTATKHDAWDAEDYQSGNADVSGAVLITLTDDATKSDGDGVAVNGNVVTVTKAGRYVVRGSLSDGQLRVECRESGTVHLILDGAAIQSQTTAPLFVRKSDKTVLTLATGSVNTLRDGDGFTYEDVENEEPSATLFSKSDLTIGGDGSLVVTSVFHDGIASRDGLKITGGTITVDAADDAVMGRDYVLVDGGELVLTAKGDGIKSTNDNDETVGFVAIEGGKLAVTSGKDGIQAQSALTVQGGEVTVTAGGGSRNAATKSDYDFGGWHQTTTDSESGGKGLKAGATLTISGGTVAVDAADDALHSNRTVVVSGGSVIASAGDDGVHADEELTVSAGTLTITDSYEGLEAKTITVNGGELSVTASDDGVNAASGNSNDGMYQSMFAGDGSVFYVHGGRVYLNAKGDGLDSNGDVVMTGGEVYVVGPSSGGNGSLDYNGSFTVTGGKLVAIGSSGMAEIPTSSTMNFISWSGFAMYDADELIVTASDGTVIAQLEALRNAQWMYITCDELVTGDEVTVTCGTQSKTFTIAEGGNNEGTSGGMFGGGGPGGDMGRPGRPGW